MFNRISICSFVLGGLVTGSVSLFAADTASLQTELTANYANFATNMPSVRTFAEAPRNFDVVNASDEERARFGFPARPDAKTEPEHYAQWSRAMQAAKIHWQGQLKAAPVRNDSENVPLMTDTMGAKPAATSGPTHGTSLNWAGVVLTKKLTSYSSTQSFRDIYSLISVQVAQLPFGGSCNPNVGETEFDQLSWVGLNGFVKGATIQPGATRGALMGGVWSYIQCSPWVPSYTGYFATFGWTGSNLLAFAVRPGDIVYTEVAAPAGGTQPSYLFIEDLTTLTYASYTVGVPSGRTFVGDSAEWIVSRPCCRGNGYPYELLNTGETFFDGGAALDNAGGTLYPGSQDPSTQVLTMRDDYSSQDIQLVYQGASGYEGSHAVMMQTTGCVWSGGCVVRY
jgi:hypothetical protein